MNQDITTLRSILPQGDRAARELEKGSSLITSLQENLALLHGATLREEKEEAKTCLSSIILMKPKLQEFIYQLTKYHNMLEAFVAEKNKPAQIATQDPTQSESPVPLSQSTAFHKSHQDWVELSKSCHPTLAQALIAHGQHLSQAIEQGDYQKAKTSLAGVYQSTIGGTIKGDWSLPVVDILSKNLQAFEYFCKSHSYMSVVQIKGRIMIKDEYVVNFRGRVNHWHKEHYDVEAGFENLTQARKELMILTLWS